VRYWNSNQIRGSFLKRIVRAQRETLWVGGLWRLVVEAKYESMWEGGAPMQWKGPMGWGCGKTGGDGGIIYLFFFPNLWEMRWEMGLKFGSGMMSGVEIRPWRKLSQFYMVLPFLRRPWWQTIWWWWTTSDSRISPLSDPYMIGS
jgi:hypothetical protein